MYISFIMFNYWSMNYVRNAWTSCNSFVSNFQIPQSMQI